jgi:hypothetical protein
MADAEQQDLGDRDRKHARRTVEPVRHVDRVWRGDFGGYAGRSRRRRDGLSLRITPGMRQKVSATMPMPEQGWRSDRRVFVVVAHARQTTVPCGPAAMRNRR